MAVETEASCGSSMEELWQQFEWTDGAIDVSGYASDFELPQIVKVDSGDYGNFGIGTQVDVQKPFLLYSGRRCSKVLAANVYWEDSKQEYVEVGPRVVIPVNYQGWFWFLQEFAKVGKTWKSVGEVAQEKPKMFMVRKPLMCYRCASVSAAPNAEKIYANVEAKAGEPLRVGGIYTETVTRNKTTCCFVWMLGKRFKQKTEHVQYLQCSDMKGFEVLIDLDKEGEFNLIGEQGSALKDAVYKLGDIVKTTELPLYVKLAQGSPPSTPCSFTGLLKLEELYFEETIIACSIGTKHPMMVEFPTDSEIQFLTATNGAKFLNHEIVKKSLDHCDDNIDTYLNSIKVVQNFYPEHVKTDVPNPVKGRCLPPLPEPDETSMAETLETMTTEDYTEDEEDDDTGDEQEEDDVVEHNYEVIPAETLQSREPPEKKYPVLDEQGYLMPTPHYAKLNKELEQSDTEPEAISDNKQKKRLSAIVFERSFCDVNPQRSSTLPRAFQSRDSTKVTSPVVPMDADHLKDRLDAFLTDSIQELDRMQRVEQTEQVKSVSSTRKNSSATNPALETDDDINAYLEKIFDCDNFSRNNSRRISRRKGSMTDAEDMMKSIRTKEILSATSSPNRQKPLKFSYSVPDATLRRHNFKNMSFLKSKIPSVEFKDDTNLNTNHKRQRQDFQFDNIAYGLEQSARINTALNNAFSPLNSAFPRLEVKSGSPAILEPPRSDSPSDSVHIPSPGSERELYDHVTNRTDSGIFLNTRWSDYTFDSESAYATPSEDSWTPPDDVTCLSVTEVARSLRYIGMKHHVVVRFVEEQIDGKQLQELDDLLMREGFPDLNALERKKVIDFANGWRPKKL